MLFVLVLAATTLGTQQDASAPVIDVVWNPQMTMEVGVTSVAGAGRLLFEYDTALGRLVDIDESTALGKAAGVAGRIVKGVFIDAPLAEIELLVIHEFFGHGARAREAGQNPGYWFRPVLPYQWMFGRSGDAFGYAETVRSGIPDRDIQVTAAGIESEQLTAWFVNRQTIARRGRMHFSEILLFGAAKIAHSVDLLTDLSNPSLSDSIDAVDYVRQLQQRFNLWTDAEKVAVARNVSFAYVFNFLDPTLWLAAYHWFISYGVCGERFVTLPMLEFGPIEVFPATRFNLTPFGAEHYVELMGHVGEPFFDAYFRGGSSGLASYVGAGLSGDDLFVSHGLRVGGAIDVWNQPQLLLDARHVFERENHWGVSVGIHARWNLYRQLGLVGKIAYKSRGYLMGQPLDKGLFGFVGITIYLGRGRS